MEVSLNGSMKGTVGQSSLPGAVSTGAAASFLAEHPTAKIVVVVNTHCLKNGKLVWKGTNTISYEACDMDEVSVICPINHYPMISPVQR